MNIISRCCKSTVDIGRRSNEFRSLDIINVCSECGKEAEEVVFTCDMCGEPADSFVQTILGDWCQTCCELNADDLIEREVIA